MNGIERHSFGKTDMQVSMLGFGGYEIGNLTVENVSLLLHQALDAGLNVIDTAECYHQSEELIGRAVGSRRSDYYLFTKCGHAAGLDLPDWSPRLLEKSIERSLQRLRTDYLDLVLLHSCSKKLLRRGEIIEVLQRARNAGKTRYIGYSGDRSTAFYAVQSGIFDALETSVNIADQEAIKLTIPAAQERQMGIIAKRPLANTAWKIRQNPTVPVQYKYWRRLTKLNYDFLEDDLNEVVSIALRFALSVPGVSTAIVGTTNPDHWQQNAALLTAGSLPQAQFEEIRMRWKRVTKWWQWIPGSRWGWHGAR